MALSGTSTPEPAFRTTADPSWERWRSIAQASQQAATLTRPADLVSLVNTNAARLGSGALEPQGPLWATGHQAWLWHPGILAKDIAAAAAAKAFGGQVLHLVLDHDVHAAMDLSWPVVHDDKTLGIHNTTLATTRLALPAANQGPVEMAEAIATLHELAVTKSSDNTLGVTTAALEQAMTDLPAVDTLGQQMAAITARLLTPWAGNVPVLLSSQVCQLAGFKQIVQWMLADATACIRAYNQAVAAYPHAGIGPLAMNREWVELPLWLLRWGELREPVYADITDSQPQLVTADGELVVEGDCADFRTPRLAPRAMLLTAVMRQTGQTRSGVTMFIHGTGGGVYDLATEAWWSRWQSGKTSTPGSSERSAVLLAPMAVVSADLRLKFDLPPVPDVTLTQAIWHVHHLPHNLDRQANLPTETLPLVKEKAELLAQMNDDRDKLRRAALFKRIHAINDQLALMTPELLREAKETLDRARRGRQNQQIALKRDWPFAIYPVASLVKLAKALDPAFDQTAVPQMVAGKTEGVSLPSPSDSSSEISGA